MGYYEEQMWDRFRNTAAYQKHIYEKSLEDTPEEAVFFEFWKEGYEAGAEAGEADAWDEAYETGYKRPKEY